ncbi:hypothetical protein D3C71_2211420 [compost metagenome]
MHDHDIVVRDQDDAVIIVGRYYFYFLPVVGFDNDHLIVVRWKLAGAHGARDHEGQQATKY